MSGSTAGLRAAFTGEFGNFRLDARLEAPAGRVTSVFGASGAGKTTLLRAVAGLVRPSGRLEVRGETWQDESRRVFLAPHRRRAGFCFQEPVLFRWLSVRGNLRYAERRAASGPAGPGFGATVERLGIEGLLDRAPSALSGGERQRVALARALLGNPRVLLLDEPLSGVHWNARAGILRWLRGLTRERGLIVLQVTHDLDEVIQIAHRIALIEDGRIGAAGPAEDVLAGIEAGGAVSRFEASALLTARVAEGAPTGGLTELDLGGQTLRIAGIGHRPGAAVRLRVRARDVALAVERPRGISIRNVLSGTVREVSGEPDTPFAEVLVALSGEGSSPLLRARITGAAAAELGLRPGTTVYALLKTVSLDDS